MSQPPLVADQNPQCQTEPAMPDPLTTFPYQVEPAMPVPRTILQSQTEPAMPDPQPTFSPRLTEPAMPASLTAFTNVKEYLRDVPMQLCVIRGFPRLLLDVNVINYLRDALITLGDHDLREKLSRKHVTGFSRLYCSTGMTEHYTDERINFVKLRGERAPAQNYCVDLPRGEIDEPTMALIQKQLFCTCQKLCNCGPSREYAQFPWLEMKLVSGSVEDMNVVRNILERQFLELCCRYDPVNRTYTQHTLAPWDPMFVNIFRPWATPPSAAMHSQIGPRFNDPRFLNNLQ